MRKAAIPPGLVRPMAIISLSLLSSLLLFPHIYRSIAIMATDFDLLSSNGAYPLVMLMFLLLWFLSSRKFHHAVLPQGASPSMFTHCPPTRHSFLGLLVAVLSLVGNLCLQGGGYFILQLFLLLGYLQGCMMFALPTASKMTLKAMAIYMTTASLPVIASTALDAPISLGFTGAAALLLKALGYPVLQCGQAILLRLPSGQTSSFYMNAACAGPASYGVFLLMNGLMLLDFDVGRKYAFSSTAAGIAALFLLNLLRIVMLVQTTYTQGESAGAALHLYIGYVLFSIFYLLYVILFIRFLPTTRHSTSRGS